MNIAKAYNLWSSSYDSVPNSTRDLEQKATQTLFEDEHLTSILELGCGTGKNTHFWASIADHVTAVDFSEGMLAIAKKKVRDNNVTFLNLDISKNWKLEQSKFDLIVCSLTLEHVNNIDHVFRQTNSCLKKDGRFYICELHPDKHISGGGHPRFTNEKRTIYVKTYFHSSSNILKMAVKYSFSLCEQKDWYTKNEESPRIISYVLSKS